jgi:hypothetical protein
MMASRAKGKVLRIVVFLVVLIPMLGYSFMNSHHGLQKIFFPLVNYLMPVSIDLKNRVVISEIMINPVGVEPGNEWIEIFNRSATEIDLHGYKLGDSEIQGDLEGMYAFPAGTHILPGQTILVANQASLFVQNYGFFPDFEISNSEPEIPDLSKYRSWSGGTINLSNSGDEVLLLDHKDDILDSVSWGNSNFAFNPPVAKPQDGNSIERSPANIDSNRAEDWLIPPEPGPGKVNLGVISSPTSTPTATQLSCEYNAILISEVFYDPAAIPEPDGEWMELFNSGDDDINLECLLVGDEETRDGGEGMLVFPKGSKMAPGNVILIANRADTFLENFGRMPDYEINNTVEMVPDLNSFPLWVPGSVSLSNSGDEIILMNIYESLIDMVSWGASNFAFDPPVPGVKPGHSISRQPANLDTNTAFDWIDLPDPQPGGVVFFPPVPTFSPTPTSTKTSSPTVTTTPTPTSTLTATPEPVIEIVINEILADPGPISGDANRDGTVGVSDDEFIEMVNSSTHQLDISGWAVGDVLDIRHIFPQGSILEANCSLVLFGGGIPDGVFGNSLVQVASSGKLGLNDGMETIYLYDSQLDIVASLSYGEEGSDDQSITRDPDIIGSLPLRKHSLAAGSGGSNYSPGTLINGDYFSGCPK